MAVEHSERGHALLSASGASRWINCTPSARLEEKFKLSEKNSDYAEEGTLAHEFGELGLLLALGDIDQKEYNKEAKSLKKHRLYNPEMDGEVQKYVDFCMEEYHRLKAAYGSVEYAVEAKLDYSHIVPEGYGTGDFLAVGGSEIVIIDLKYGKGISVSAEKNAQLSLYGLAGVDMYEMMYDLKTVKLIIIQPRLDNYSGWSTSKAELIEWSVKIVRPAALKAFEGKGLQKSGPWCKWCNVKAMCATLAADNIKLARHEFKDPHLLSDEVLVDIMKQQPMLVDWVKAVQAHILKEAIGGKKFKGFKVVEGTSKRAWKNENLVVAKLTELGLKEKDIFDSKLKGIPDMEKLVKKNNLGNVLTEFINKPAGSPTLVPDSDRRPELGSAKQATEDFDD